MIYYRKINGRPNLVATFYLLRNTVFEKNSSGDFLQSLYKNSLLDAFSYIIAIYYKKIYGSPNFVVQF